MTLNGRPFDWRKPTITYEEIAHIVGHRDVTVTYRFASGISGELTRGDVIAVSPELVINAQHTGAA